MRGIYIVKRGDTLTKIAHAHNTTPRKIAMLNHIANMDYIRVGQKLKLPAPVPSAPAPAPKPAPPPHKTEPEQSVTDEIGHLYIRFLDALEQPIAKMKTWIKIGDQEAQHTTDKHGNIPVVVVNKPNTKVSVSVAKAKGGKKEVSVITAKTGQITSGGIFAPKSASESQQRRHEGSPPQAKPDKKPEKAGTKHSTRSDNGNPVWQYHCQCPNKENLKLRLGNEVFRDTLIAAGKRCGFTSTTLAAIIEAEANPRSGTIVVPIHDKNGKPVMDPETNKPKTRKEHVKNIGWKIDSYNSAAGASGLTQFIHSTWLMVAMNMKSELHKEAVKRGWITVTHKMVKQRNNELKPIPVFHFKFANGATLSGDGNSLARKLSSKTYVHQKTYKAYDANLQALLDLRFGDGKMAIHAAADYAKINIDWLVLEKRFSKVSSLIDSEKAKLAYLCHHLGANDALNVINKTMTPGRAKIVLLAQFGLKGKDKYKSEKAYQEAFAKAKAKAEKYIQANITDYVQAHRKFIEFYVDDHIKIENHMCDVSACKKPRSIIDIVETI